MIQLLDQEIKSIRILKFIEINIYFFLRLKHKTRERHKLHIDDYFG